MIRLPENDDTEDFGSKGDTLALETSTAPIVQNTKSKKSFKWIIFVCIAILIAFGVFISRASRLPYKHPISQQPMSSIKFVQTSKERDPSIHNTTWRGDYAKRVLCKVLEDENCQSNYIADVIDLAWVVAPIYSFDPDSDWKILELHRYFKGYIRTFGLNFITIEAIRFPGDADQRPWSREPREYTETVPGNEPYDIQVYYYNVSYIRENLLNVAIRKLDKQKPWEYAIWIDGHQFFENSYWWEESIYKMEKYASVQLCGSIHYYNHVNKSDVALTYSVIRASLLTDTPMDFIIITGNAYGIRRDLYYAIDYIYDECIATSCDVVYTSASLPGDLLFPKLFPPYYKNFDTYINRTKQIFKGSRTFVRGHMWHFVHGWGFPYGPVQISVGENGFNASLHLKRDENFTLYITNMTISAELDNIILDYKRKNPYAH